MNKKGELWVLDYFHVFGWFFIVSLVLIFSSILLSNYISREIDIDKQQADLILERALHEDCFGFGVNGMNIDNFNGERINGCMEVDETFGVSFSLRNVSKEKVLVNEDTYVIYSPVCSDEDINCYSRHLPVLLKDGNEVILEMEVVTK